MLVGGSAKTRAVVLSRVLARAASQVQHRVVEAPRPGPDANTDASAHAGAGAGAGANAGPVQQLELELKITKGTCAVWPFLFLEDDPRLLAQMRSNGRHARACSSASAFSSSSDSEED